MQLSVLNITADCCDSVVWALSATTYEFIPLSKQSYYQFLFTFIASKLGLVSSQDPTYERECLVTSGWYLGLH